MSHLTKTIIGSKCRCEEPSIVSGLRSCQLLMYYHVFERVKQVYSSIGDRHGSDVGM